MARSRAMPSSTRPPPRSSTPSTIPLSPPRAERPLAGRALPAPGDLPPAHGGPVGGVRVLPHLHTMVRMITSGIAAVPWSAGLLGGSDALWAATPTARAGDPRPAPPPRPVPGRSTRSRGEEHS